MRVFFNIIKWAIRIIFYIIIVVIGTKNGYSMVEALKLWCGLIIAELILSVCSLVRATPDDIFAVVTGFDGCGPVGHYEVTDNVGCRILGFVGLIASFLMRVTFLFIIINTFNGGTIIAGSFHPEAYENLFSYLIDNATIGLENFTKYLEDLAETLKQKEELK